MQNRYAVAHSQSFGAQRERRSPLHAEIRSSWKTTATTFPKDIRCKFRLDFERIRSTPSTEPRERHVSAPEDSRGDAGRNIPFNSPPPRLPWTNEMKSEIVCSVLGGLRLLVARKIAEGIFRFSTIPPPTHAREGHVSHAPGGRSVVIPRTYYAPPPPPLGE